MEIKLVVPALLYNPEHIILDARTALEHNIEFKRLFINHTVEYFIAEHLLEENCSTYLNKTNMHWLCYCKVV